MSIQRLFLLLFLISQDILTRTMKGLWDSKQMHRLSELSCQTGAFGWSSNPVKHMAIIWILKLSRCLRSIEKLIIRVCLMHILRKFVALEKQALLPVCRMHTAEAELLETTEGFHFMELTD